MFDELKEKKYFKQITDLKSLIMPKTLKKKYFWRVSKKQKPIKNPSNHLRLSFFVNTDGLLFS